jgi:hypothetical protein
MAGGSLSPMDEVPEEVKRVFATAFDIAPAWHVRMQAAFQRHTDNAVSKTINFPARATKQDVRSAFHLAYREGVKGITIFRSGSKNMQLTCRSPVLLRWERTNVLSLISFHPCSPFSMLLYAVCMLRPMVPSCVSTGLLLPFLLRFRYLFRHSAKNSCFCIFPRGEIAH